MLNRREMLGVTALSATLPLLPPRKQKREKGELTHVFVQGLMKFEMGREKLEFPVNQHQLILRYKGYDEIYEVIELDKLPVMPESVRLNEEVKIDGNKIRIFFNSWTLHAIITEAIV